MPDHKQRWGGNNQRFAIKCLRICNCNFLQSVIVVKWQEMINWILWIVPFFMLPATRKLQLTLARQAGRQTLMVSMRAVELHNLMVLLLLLLVASERHNSPFITLVAAACCDEKIAVAKYGSWMYRAGSWALVYLLVSCICMSRGAIAITIRSRWWLQQTRSLCKRLNMIISRSSWGTKEAKIAESDNQRGTQFSSINYIQTGNSNKFNSCSINLLSVAWGEWEGEVQQKKKTLRWETFCCAFMWSRMIIIKKIVELLFLWHQVLLIVPLHCTSVIWRCSVARMMKMLMITNRRYLP